MYYIKLNFEIYFENLANLNCQHAKLISVVLLFLYYASVILQILKTMAVQILPQFFFVFVFFIAGKRLHIYYSFLNIPKCKKKPLLTFYSVNEWHIKMFKLQISFGVFFFFHVKQYRSVVLTLDDINDESPVFDYPSYQILIPEVHLRLIDFAY